MSPVTVVTLISVIAFLFGAAAPVVFGPPEEQRTRTTVLDWLVRGLVGAAVAHAALGVYDMIETSRAADDLGGAFLSGTMMSLFAFTGILLGLAALVHLLSRRSAAGPSVS